MPDAIQITQADLQRLNANQINAVMARSGASWYQLTMTVKNVSSTVQYVLTEIHHIAYDSMRRTLAVGLSERDTPKERPGLDVPPPAQYRAVAPGETLQLGGRLSSPITFMHRTTEGPKPSFVRIPEDVDSVECTVAFGAEPPPQTTNLASLEPLRDTRDWGGDVTRSLPLSGRSQL